MSPISLVLIALLAAPPTPAPAGPPEGPGKPPSADVVRLTLSEAIARARVHSAHLAQLAALDSAATAAVRGARAGRLPVVDLSASYTLSSDVPELTIIAPGPPPFRQTVFPNIPSNYKTRAALSLPLYTGGRLSGGIAAAKDQQTAAAKDLEGGQQDLVLETTAAYWSLLGARESARVLAEAIASYEAHLKSVRDRMAVGLAARNDLLAVRVDRDAAELARLEAGNFAALAEANLIRLVGLAFGARIEPLETVAPARPAEPADALIASALTARPEIAALRARVAAAQSSTKIARSASLPQLAFSAAFDYAKPNPRILPLTDEWNDTWTLGVAVAWNAFDGGRASAAVAQARAQAEALGHQLQDLERRVRLEVEGRVLDLATAQAQRAVAEKALEAARENVRVLQDRYREGVSSSFELLDGETKALKAGLELTLSTTQIQVAMANLDRAVGR